ncbi:MAG: hypothetical protein QOK02_4448 [Mycobacterium sp.]|jgi:hypothetical protein|nr:hypothetical protein [Mycobacterium sp.]
MIVRLDAGCLETSTVMNAILDAGFWAFAADLFTPEQSGVMTAVVYGVVAS